VHIENFSALKMKEKLVVVFLSVLWIRIRIILGTVTWIRIRNPHPHQIKIRSGSASNKNQYPDQHLDPHQSDSWIRNRIQISIYLHMTSQNVWNMSLFKLLPGF
jgi:hypothetical protein